MIVGPISSDSLDVHNPIKVPIWQDLEHCRRQYTVDDLPEGNGSYVP